MSDPTLDELIEAARFYRPTAAERERQRRSFAHGNISMHNPDVTRAVVGRAADELERENGNPKR